MDWSKLNRGRIPFKALNRIRSDVLIQVTFLGEPLGASKRSGLDRTRDPALHLPPGTTAFTAAYVGVVAKVTTNVTYRSVLLRPFPTAYLA